MAQITGRATIRVDGNEYRTNNNATLNPGGVNREARTGGGKVYGYVEDDVPPSLECSVEHTQDVSLKAMGEITSATVLFETDTGKRFILREAFVTEAPSLSTPAGTVDLKFSAISCDEE